MMVQNHNRMRVVIAVLALGLTSLAEAATSTTTSATGPTSAPVDTSAQVNTDPSPAFQDGIQTGQQAYDPSAPMNSTTAQSLPGYNDNPPETQYVNSSSAASAETAAQAKQQTSDTYSIATTSKQGVDQNISLTNGTDPIYQQSSPQDTIGQQFAGCSTVTGTASGAVTLQTCTATPPLTVEKCSKTLAVDVQKQQTCQLGAGLTTINTYTLILPRKGWYGSSSSTVTCGPALDGTHQVNVSVQTFWGSGNFSFMLAAATPGVQWSGVVAGVGFTFTSQGCDVNFNCTLSVSDGYQTWAGTFPLSRVYYTQTDTWTDACVPLAARVLP